jgi:hypothetical protein
MHGLQDWLEVSEFLGIDDYDITVFQKEVGCHSHHHPPPHDLKRNPMILAWLDVKENPKKKKTNV